MEEIRKYVLVEYNKIFEDEVFAENVEKGTYEYAVDRLSGTKSEMDQMEENEEELMVLYKQIYIRLLYNLKFKDVAIPDDIDPLHVARIPREMLSSEKWDRMYKNRTDDGAKKRKKGAHKCGKCGSWYTSHTESQQRSADESMTIHVVCSDCGHNFKYN